MIPVDSQEGILFLQVRAFEWFFAQRIARSRSLTLDAMRNSLMLIRYKPRLAVAMSLVSWIIAGTF